MNKNFKKGILLAPGELFLKSEPVKKIFKRKLLNNLSFFLKKENINFKIDSQRGRIFIETEGIKKTFFIMKRIFGISWFAESLFFPKATLNDISSFVQENWKDWIKEKESFALRLRKTKEMKKKRAEIIDEIAKHIKRKVDLENPDETIFIEVRKKGWFLYFKKEKGQGGLPGGVSGKVLSLISGGIDSAVSSFLIAKRGAKNVWLHFHSFPIVSQKSIKKTEQLAKIFLNYQPNLKIYFLPFGEAQKEIKIKIEAKYRILLYRRLMFKIAEKIAKKENCEALITGESLGQVSSQTLPNIKIITKDIKTPILRPLIGKDKKEIIKIAREIGTYQVSIKPQEDCCSLFVPGGQTAKGNFKKVKELEKKLEIKKIVDNIIEKTEVKEY